MIFVFGQWIRIFLVLTFNLWKSMQKHRPPSFFLTNTTALHHGLWLGQIAPASNISLTWALISSTIGGGILQYLSLKGSSSTTLISCFARLVHPNSLGSSENMWWYLVSSHEQMHGLLQTIPPVQINLAVGGASPFC